MNRFSIYILSVFFISSFFTIQYCKYLNIAFGPSKSRINNTNVPLNYICDSTDYNTALFVGSSTVRAGINPYIIDSVTGLKSYCVALNGMSISWHYLLLQKYIAAHPKPKYIFLNVDIMSLNTKGGIYDETIFYPFLQDSLFRSVLIPKDYKFKSFYPIVQTSYRFRKLLHESDDRKLTVLLNLGRGRTITPIAYDDSYSTLNYYRGYYPIVHQGYIDTQFEKGVYSEEGISTLNKFIALCKQNSIQLFLIQMPMYKDYVRYPEMQALNNRLETIAKQHDLTFLQYNKDSICNSKDYFKDLSHLNSIGAGVFSHRMAADLSGIIHTDSTLLLSK